MAMLRSRRPVIMRAAAAAYTAAQTASLCNRPTKPLEGFRVLEIGQLIAGPFCGTILGYFGAEVIKIESPGSGDPIRKWRELDTDGTSPWWRSIGRNKKSVTVDLRTEEGREIVRALAQRSDVLVENFKPGTLEKWKLGPEDLGKLNPQLILTRLSGYGQTGPYSNRPGFASVCEAFGGFRHLNGFADRPPVRPNISMGDTLAGLHAALGTTLGLLARERRRGEEALARAGAGAGPGPGVGAAAGAAAGAGSGPGPGPGAADGAADGAGAGAGAGVGAGGAGVAGAGDGVNAHARSPSEVVDVAIYEAVFNLLEGVVPEYDRKRVVRAPSGSTVTGIVPTNTYVCADGKYVVVGGNGDCIFKRLMVAAGREDLASDARLSDNVGRVAHMEEIDGAISTWTRTIDAARVLEILSEAQVPAGLIYSVADIFNDPHYAARGMFETATVDALQSEVKLPALCPRLAHGAGGTEWAGPELGEHTRQVLSEVLEMDDQTMRKLHDAGVVSLLQAAATTPPPVS